MLADLINWLAELVSVVFDWVAAIVGWVTKTLWESLVWVFDWIWENFEPLLVAIADGVAGVIIAAVSALPVPEALGTLQTVWNGVPWGELGFFLAPFEVEYGLAILFGTRALKFSLRWVPWLGRAFQAASN